MRWRSRWTRMAFHLQSFAAPEARPDKSGDRVVRSPVGSEALVDVTKIVVTHRMVHLACAFVLFALGAPELAPPTECKSASGQTACGYHCKVGDSGPKCAKTPEGICMAEGPVACFDPPAYVRRILGSELPRPRCISHDNQVACGYSCAHDYGKSLCASTPQGICRAEAGQVVCFDPPASLFAAYQRAALPTPECKSESGKLACGYHCNVSNGQVRCSRTPQGVCRADYGRIECFDPAAEIFCAYGPNVPPAQCLSSDDKIACGFHCLTGHG